MVRSGTAILGRVPKELLTFATLTLPFGPELFRESAERWPHAVNLLEHRLRENLVKNGIEPEYVHVTEPQKRGALHLHLVFQGKANRKSGWAFTPKQIESWWREIWQTVLGKRVEQYNWGSSTRIEGIRKSLIGYLSKYLSKADYSLPDEWKPSSWYGMSEGLRAQIKKEVVIVKFEAFEWDWERFAKRISGRVQQFFTAFFVLESGLTWALYGRAAPDDTGQILNQLMRFATG